MSESVKQVALQVSKSSPNKVPSYLISIKDILQDSKSDIKKLSEICLELWNYNIIHLCVSILKQDVHTVIGSWNASSDLVDVICIFSQNFQPKDKKILNNYRNQLYLASSHTLRLALELQGKDSNYSDHEECFLKFLNTLRIIVSEHPFLVPDILSDQYFLHLLIASRKDCYFAALDLFNHLLDIIFKYNISLECDVSLSILEEIISQMHFFSDQQIGRLTLQILLKWTENTEYIVDILQNKVKNVQLLKKSQGNGFDAELHHLFQLLERFPNTYNDEVYEQAALKIQSAYRGYRVRKWLKNLKISITKFQRFYREKIFQQQQIYQEYIQKRDLKYQEIINRTQKLQCLHKSQLQTIEMMRAGDVDSYLQELLTKMAIKIQAVWRGYRSRQKVLKMKEDMKDHKAASLIQKHVRLWLARCKQRHQSLPDSSVFNQSRLYDDRTHLEVLLEHWTRQHPVLVPVNEQERENLQLKAREALNGFYLSLPVYKKQMRHLDTLLLQSEADAALLTNPPSLEEVESMDTKLFYSSSAVVTSAAKMAHEQEMKKLNFPLWKNLTDTDPSFGVSLEILIRKSSE